MKPFSASFVAVAACLLIGGCKSMTPGQLGRVQPYSDKPYAGNVYLLRGFIGIWSYGIDHLGQKIANSGVRASVFQEDQWDQLADQIIEKYRSAPDREPLVLIGHSYGADDALKIARKLEEHQMTVDLIITLDPVTPPPVPANVRLCYNIYQPNALDALPFFRGVSLQTQDPRGQNLQNVNMRKDRRDLLEDKTDHFNIEKNAKVHAEVVAKVKEFCPPRQMWVSRTQPGRSLAPGGSMVSPPAAPAKMTPAPVGRAGGGDPRLDRIP